jgi:hypothetical protein
MGWGQGSNGRLLQAQDTAFKHQNYKKKKNGSTFEQASHYRRSKDYKQRKRC